MHLATGSKHVLHTSILKGLLHLGPLGTAIALISLVSFLLNWMQVDLIQDPNVAPTKSYKILIIGSAGVGKTCFLMHLCNNTFSHSYTTTLGKYYCFGNRHHVRHDIMQVIHTHTHIYIYTHMHTYIYIYAHMHTHIYICTHAHTVILPHKKLCTRFIRCGLQADQSAPRWWCNCTEALGHSWTGEVS